MGYDIERFVEGGAQSTERLSWSANQIERRRENAHVVRRNDIRREVELAIADEGRKLLERLARFERYGRETTEAKFRLERAKKESQLLQGDDPELRAKFAVLDDDLLQRVRFDLLHDE